MLFKQINNQDKNVERLPKGSATPQSLFKVRSAVKVGALDLSALSLHNLSQSTGTLDQTLQEDTFNRV